MEREEILRRLIMEKTGMKRPELDRLVEKRIKEFAGLLTELGALYTIARDYGIDIDMDTVTVKKKIGELKPGDKGVNVVGVVRKIFPVRTFVRDGRERKYVSFILEDENDSIRVVLWDNTVPLIEKIKPGAKVEVINGRVNLFKGKPSISVGWGGSINILEEGKGRKIKILRVRKGEYKNGIYTSVLGAEGERKIRLTFWDDVDIEPGDTVLVWGREEDGRIIVDSYEVLEKGERKTAWIGDMEEGPVRVVGVVTRLVSRKPFVGKCKKCGGEIVFDGNFKCTQCGSEDVSALPSLIIEITDPTGSVRVALERNEALKYYEGFPEVDMGKVENMLVGKMFVAEGLLENGRIVEAVLKEVNEKIVEEVVSLVQGEGPSIRSFEENGEKDF